MKQHEHKPVTQMKEVPYMADGEPKLYRIMEYVCSICGKEINGHDTEQDRIDMKANDYHDDSDPYTL